MRPRYHVALGLVLLLFGFDDAERIETWDRWREDPLDLRDAPAADLARLPGADPHLAAAIVRLRRLRPDFDRDDLLRLEGLDAHRLDEWAPMVRWEREGPAHGVDVEVQSEGGSRRARTGVRRGSWIARGVVRDTPEVARGWIAGRVGSIDLIAGALRPDVGSGASVADGLGRSRTGAARRPRAGRLRGRTDGGEDPGWRGVGAARPLGAGRVQLLLARDGDDRATWLTAWESSRAGVSASGRGATARFGVWTRRSVDARTDVWVEAGASPRLDRGITVAGLRTRLADWRVDAAWSRADVVASTARDPITGAVFDRAHAAWQVRLRGREGPLRIHALLRHRRRGPGDDRRLRADVVWVRPRRSDAAPRWTARATVGVDDDLVAERTETLVRTDVERSTPGVRVVVSWSRRGSVVSPAEILALRVRRRAWAGGRLDTEFGAATAAGDRAAPWFVVRPVAGVRPLWVPPRGHAAWLAAGLRVGRARLAAWGWWRGPIDEGATGWGIALRHEAGAVVRRLQSDP